MPDRMLTVKELFDFVHEEPDKPFSALVVHQNENQKPTLYDLCIYELLAKIDGLAQIVIQQGRKIKELESK